MDVSSAPLESELGMLAAAPGWRVIEVAQAVQAAKASATQISVELQPAVRCSPLRVLDSGGSPVEGVPVALSANAMPRDAGDAAGSDWIPVFTVDAIHRGVSNKLGDVVFEYLPPGKYILRTHSDWFVLDDEGEALSVDAECAHRASRTIAPILAAILEVHPPGGPLMDLVPHDALLQTESQQGPFMAVAAALLQRHPGTSVVMGLGHDALHYQTGFRGQVRRRGTRGLGVDVTLVPPSRLGAPIAINLAVSDKKEDRGEVTVRVTDSRGEELKDVELSFVPLEGRVRAGAGLTSQPVKLRPGRYRMRFTGDVAGQGYVLGELTVKPGESQTVEHRLTLSLRTVILQVTLRDGSSPAYAIVNMTTSSGKSSIRSMRPERIPIPVATGTVEFLVHVQGYKPAKLESVIAEGPWADPVQLKLVVE